jgi:hypothetical protein
MEFGSRTPSLILVSLCAALYATFAHGDEIDDCIAKEQRAYEQPQQFSTQGDITCPAGDISGFPPRLRRHDRQGTVSFTAPAGFVIENRAISSVVVQVVSSNNGTTGSPSLSPDARTITVPISCQGRGPGEGRAWHSVRVVGSIVRNAPPEMQKRWAIECVRCLVGKSCSGLN